MNNLNTTTPQPTQHVNNSEQMNHTKGTDNQSKDYSHLQSSNHKITFNELSNPDQFRNLNKTAIQNEKKIVPFKRKPTTASVPAEQ